MDPLADKPLRFLSFANDKQDAEKEATLKEAAKKIERAIAREKSLEELIDYVAPDDVNEDFTNDTRPLYVRLQEQKNKKKEVDEETQKLSNFVSKLDEEDIDYLNEVEKNKREEELKKRLEVYDALESKRRLDEQKVHEEEKRRKESLLNSTLIRKESHIKSKFTHTIKMKPKIRAPINDDSNRAGFSGHVEDKNDAQVVNKRPLSADDQSEHAIKRQTVHESVAKSIRPTNTDEGPNAAECTCPKIMKCIGILPSLPQVSGARKMGEDSSSDQSDDELHRRLVPQIRTRK